MRERFCFIIEGISLKLILGDKDIDDNATLCAFAWELYHSAIEIFKLAHPATILPARLKGLPHRLALVSLMSLKHVRVTCQANLLGLSFKDTGRADPLRAALLNLCINEGSSLFVGGGLVEVRLRELDNSPGQRENYQATAAINQRLEETDETVIVKNVRLNARAVSSPKMIHDNALTIVGCQGFIPILRQGRDDPVFICLLKWTMPNVYVTHEEMTESIVTSNRARRGDLTPRPLPRPVAMSSLPTRSTT